jgi:hypothetical protein
LISNKFEEEIVFESSGLAWIWSRIRIELKCWIRIRIESIRIHNPEKNILAKKSFGILICGIIFHIATMDTSNKKPSAFLLTNVFSQCDKYFHLNRMSEFSNPNVDPKTNIKI